jgi:similar to stage IV sporulation protein
MIVSGPSPERLVAAMVDAQIDVRAIVRVTPEKLFCTVFWHDAWKLPALRRSLRLRIRFVHRTGVPALWMKCMMRKTFLYGAIGCILALHALSSVVWDVRIVGTQTMQQSDVWRAVASLGIVPGIPKRALSNAEDVSRTLSLLLPGASWIGVFARGTVVTIRIAEAHVPPPVERLAPQHIVARTDGVITRITAQSGVAIVGTHAYVRRGDVLIRGYLEDDTFVERTPVAAQGVVRAHVWLTHTIRVPRKTTEWYYTGEVQRTYALTSAGRTWQLRGTTPQHARTMRQATPVHLFGWTLPLTYTTDTHYAVAHRIQRFTSQQAQTAALAHLRAHIYETYGLDARIVRHIVLHVHDDAHAVIIKAVHAVEMNIGTPQPFVP